jgi:MFS family permease
LKNNQNKKNTRLPWVPQLLKRSLKSVSKEHKESLFTKEFVVLMLCSLLLMTGIGVFYLFPLFVLDRGGDKTDIGFLMGMMGLSAVLTRPWISGLVDQIGRKRSVICAGLVLTLVSIAHLFCNGTIGEIYPVLLCLRFLFGAGMALSIIATLTLAADLVSGPRLNEGFGIFGLMPMVGIAIGPIAGEMIVNRYGLDGMFITAALFFFTGCIMITQVKERFAPSSGATRGNFIRALRFPVVWRMSCICLCFGLAFAAHGGFVAPFAKSIHLSISWYFAFYSAAAVLSRLFVGRLSSRFGDMRIIPGALVLSGLGFTTLAQVTSSLGLIGAGFTSGLGHGLLFPCLIALTIRPIAIADRGKVTGIITGGVDLGLFIGSVVMGQLGNYFGFQSIFAAAALTMLVGLLSFWKMKAKILHYNID